MRCISLAIFLSACAPSYMGEKPTSGEGVADTGTSPADDTDVTETEDTDVPEETDSGSADDTGAVEDTGEPVDTGTSPADDTGTEPSEDTDLCSENCGDTGSEGGEDSGTGEDTGSEPVDTSVVYADEDGDGSTDDVDCNDSNAAVYPGASESCDSVDNDCDGSVDEGVTTRVYRDLDGDDYGDELSGTDACGVPSGYTDRVGDMDCNDADASINPGATETANDGIDQDCDESDLVTETDADGDGYGESTDCDESDAEVNPGATESCNEIDDDCDGSTDEGVSIAYWPDVDGDGFGDDSSVSYWGCTGSSGYVTNSNDCDDGDEDINPDAAEVMEDGIDQDCDGSDSSLTALLDEAECEDAAAACFVDVDEDGNYETLLMDGGQWDLPELEDADAEIYENGYGSGCGIDGDTVESNSAGYYVISFSGFSSCTSQVSLVSGGYWWNNYDFCKYDDADGICVSTGTYEYMLGIDYRASSGLQF